MLLRADSVYSDQTGWMSIDKTACLFATLVEITFSFLFIIFTCILCNEMISVFLCRLVFMIKLVKYPTPYIYVCIIILLCIPSNVSLKIAPGIGRICCLNKRSACVGRKFLLSLSYGYHFSIINILFDLRNDYKKIIFPTYRADTCTLLPGC